MLFFSRVKVSTKLYGLSILMIIVVGILTIVAFKGFNSIKNEIELLNNERFVKYQKISAIENKVKTANSWLYQISIDVLRELDHQDINNRIKAFEDILISVKDELQTYTIENEALDLSNIKNVSNKIWEIEDNISALTEENNPFINTINNTEKLESLLTQYVLLSTVIYQHKVLEIMPMVKNMGLMGAELGGSMMSGTEADYENLLIVINDLKQVEIKLANISYDNAINTYSKSLKTFIIVAALGSLLMLLFMALVIHSIVKPLGLLVSTMGDIAHGEGDLTVRLPEEGNNEITLLSHNFNLFAARIQSLVLNVQEESSNIAGIANDVLRSIKERNTISQCQLNETESVSSAIDNLSVFSSDVMTIASDASDSSTQSKNTTIEANKVINNTINDMQSLGDKIISTSQVVERLGENSQNIDMILDVIISIAEQTNLLALNAAIEAARAGEQGRGFAVVADEVRTLAQKSSDATEKIQDVIKTIKDGAEDASLSMSESKVKAETIINEAYTVTESIKNIIVKIESNDSLSHMIAEKSRQQMDLVKNVQGSTIAIKQGASQSVTASMQEKKLGTTLDQHADNLSNLISQFKV